MTQNKIISIDIMIDTSNFDMVYLSKIGMKYNTPFNEVIAKIQKIKGVIATKNQRIVSEKEAISFLSSNQISSSLQNGENTQ